MQAGQPKRAIKMMDENENRGAYVPPGSSGAAITKFGNLVVCVCCVHWGITRRLCYNHSNTDVYQLMPIYIFAAKETKSFDRTKDNSYAEERTY